MGSTNVGSLKADLTLDGSQFNKAMAGISKEMNALGKQMKSVGRSMSLMLSAPIAAFGALTLKTAGDFEAGMNRVAAVSGASADQLEKLRDVAEDMGRTTQFSASEAADALGFLAMAGFDANEAASALPGTLQLAASAGIELAQAADIVSNVLSGYGLEVENLAHLNDVLVKTFTSSNTNLEQLGEAMTYVAPIAASAGVQFEETAAALGLLGNAGIQASMAGTTLRGAIGKMLNPADSLAKKIEDAGLSFTDAEGRLRPLADIIEQLEPIADDTGFMLEIFGQRAGPGMAALVSQGSDALRELTSELENSTGTAAEIAAARMEGFNGALKELRSAFEALQIAIGDSGVLEFMEGMVDGLKEVLLKLSEANPRLLRFGSAIATMVAIIGPVLVVLGTLSIAIAAISGPVLLVVAGLAALAAGAVLLTGATGDASVAADTHSAAELALMAALDQVNASSKTSVEWGRNLANQHKLQAEAAVAAARAELALAKAAQQSFEETSTLSGRNRRPSTVGHQRDVANNIAQLEQAEKSLAGIEAQIIGLDTTAALASIPFPETESSKPGATDPAVAAAAAAAAWEKLRGQIDPTVASAKKLADGTLVLDNALATGIITQEEYNAAMAQLQEKLNGSGSSGSGGASGALSQTSEEAEKARTAFDNLLLTLDPTAAATKELADSIEILDEALAKGVITQEEYNSALGQLHVEADSFSEDVGSSIGNAFSGAFDGLIDGTLDARDALSNLANDLAKMAANAIFQQLLGGLGGGGGFLDGLLGAFGGARAGGGPMSPGKFYLVGEDGPEFVQTSSPSLVIPNHDLGSVVGNGSNDGGLGGASAAPEVNITNIIVNDESRLGEFMQIGPGDRIMGMKIDKKLAARG